MALAMRSRPPGLSEKTPSSGVAAVTLSSTTDMATSKGRRKRASKPKVRTGCITCKVSIVISPSLTPRLSRQTTVSYVVAIFRVPPTYQVI